LEKDDEIAEVQKKIEKLKEKYNKIEELQNELEKLKEKCASKSNQGNEYGRMMDSLAEEKKDEIAGQKTQVQLLRDQLMETNDTLLEARGEIGTLTPLKSSLQDITKKYEDAIEKLKESDAEKHAKCTLLQHDLEKLQGENSKIKREGEDTKRILAGLNKEVCIVFVCIVSKVYSFSEAYHIFLLVQISVVGEGRQYC
jgi:chromosome segregation ATPase